MTAQSSYHTHACWTRLTYPQTPGTRCQPNANIDLQQQDGDVSQLYHGGGTIPHTFRHSSPDRYQVCSPLSARKDIFEPFTYRNLLSREPIPVLRHTQGYPTIGYILQATRSSQKNTLTTALSTLVLLEIRCMGDLLA